MNILHCLAAGEREHLILPDGEAVRISLLQAENHIVHGIDEDAGKLRVGAQGEEAAITGGFYEYYPCHM